jgi:hypothetical protein
VRIVKRLPHPASSLANGCGRFAGQLAWVPRQYARDRRLHVLGWVPTEDVVDLGPDGTIDPEV